jgi:hypothetical protein
MNIYIIQYLHVKQFNLLNESKRLINAFGASRACSALIGLNTMGHPARRILQRMALVDYKVHRANNSHQICAAFKMMGCVVGPPLQATRRVCHRPCMDEITACQYEQPVTPRRFISASLENLKCLPENLKLQLGLAQST